MWTSTRERRVHPVYTDSLMTRRTYQSRFRYFLFVFRPHLPPVPSNSYSNVSSSIIRTRARRSFFRFKHFAVRVVRVIRRRLPKSDDGCLSGTLTTKNWSCRWAFIGACLLPLIVSPSRDEHGAVNNARARRENPRIVRANLFRAGI